MKIINHLKLYIDTLSRFNAGQLVYWIMNHYIKPVYLFKLIKKKDIDFLFIRFSDFTCRLKNLKDSFNIYWVKTPVSLDDEQKIHHYFRDLAKQFITLRADETDRAEKFWNVDDPDFEVLNNYQRFHLFAEISTIAKVNSITIILLITKWISIFKPKKNIAWNSFNCSVRLINWMKMFTLIAEGFQVDENEWRKIQISIYKQADYISKTIELHIPGNHVLIQYYSLWLVNILFPGWKQSISTLNNINYLFEQETKKEFTNSGLHFEQSYHYHLQATLISLVWLKYMISSGIYNVTTSTKTTMKKACECVKSLTLGEKYFPMFSDICFNFMNISLQEDYQDILKLEKQIFLSDNRKILKNIIDIKNQYVKAKNANSELIFDVGNIGLKNNPGHGHADLLNVYYLYKKKPIFIDPGTRKYSSSSEDLMLKRTTSHNTLSINGEDQAKLWGFFRWAFLPDSPNYFVENNNDQIVIRGRYFGFKHIGGVEHQRVIRMKDNVFMIEDKLLNKLPNKVQLNFILAPAFKPFVHNNTLLINDNDLELSIMVDSENKFVFNIVDFSVYPAYNVEVKSHKVEIFFPDVIYPFKSKITVKPNE